MQQYRKKVAIITGASSGMGKEFVKQLNNRLAGIDEFWLIARRRELLEELREEIHRPCVLIAEDISEQSFLTKFHDTLEKEHPQVTVLVNCAGFGRLGPVAQMDNAISTGMIATNCMGLTAVTREVLPYMETYARIINLASSAAFLPQPDFAVYAASKSYVLSFSRSLNQELKKRKIFVTAVCPGPVNTQFFTLAEQGRKRPWYKELFMVNCEDVVAKALEDAKAKKELSIYGGFMKIFYLISKIIPHRVLLKIVGFLNMM